MIETNINTRPENQKSVLNLACLPIPLVRIGFVGLGYRAMRAVNRFVHIEGAQINALCDIRIENINEAQLVLRQHGYAEATEYLGEKSWQQLCENDEVDLLYVCTDWLSHAQIATYAMKHGKHVALEVPAGMTVDECWQLVDTAEQTQHHCIMLEDCCYDPFELTTLNMVKQDVFGEIVHAEAAYIHYLFPRMFLKGADGRLVRNWQNEYYRTHTGNPYPTHGLGPVCQALNIHRGDKMNYLVSMSSKQAGISHYMKEQFGKDSEEAALNYQLGDMNTSLIHTAKGKTIMLQHSIALPRPYSRAHALCGTKGHFQKYPQPSFTLLPEWEAPMSDRLVDLLFEKFEHPFVKKYGKRAHELCDERARDFIMDSRLIYCLRNGLPLDMDVYDAAEWSCIVELSELSVKNGSTPVQIPDFTRGEWNRLDGLSFAE